MNVSPLHIENGKIINAAGKKVSLKGVNFGGWLMMEGYILGGRNIPEHVFLRKLRKAAGEKEIDLADRIQ